MKRSLSSWRFVRVALAVLAILSFGCQRSAREPLSGHFTSSDDFGVIVFRSDGVFGYKSPAKTDFYSESNLPPQQGRFHVSPTGVIELDGPPARLFTLQLRDSGSTLLLTRLTHDGGLPQVAVYHRQ